MNHALILEHLKAVQAKLARMANDISDIKTGNRAHRSLTTGLVRIDRLHGKQIADLQARLVRIERRLELGD